VPGGRDALKYAEETLGVHSVYGEAQAHARNADERRRTLAEARRNKVMLEEAYTDAELAFIADERAQNADMSQTAFEKHVKGRIHADPELRKLRGQLANHARNMDLIEADLRKAQNLLDVTTARLHELGGYLAYLAAIKHASSLAPAVPVWPGVSST